MTLTPRALPVHLATLETMERSALLDAWRAVHGAPPPKNLSVVFMRKALAFEAQTAVLGSTKKRVAQKLDRPAPAKAAPPAPKLPIGAQLIRDWNGRTYRVTVSPHGFELNGQSWRSLSAIARHITGAQWSGPRFFGLTSAPGSRADKAAA